MTKKILLLCIFVSFTSVAFSQEKSNVLPFRPRPSWQEELDLDREIDRVKEDIRNSRYFGKLYVYVALREDDPSLCPNGDCEQYVREEAMHSRYDGEGRCNEIKDPGHRKICEALKFNNCSQLSGAEREYCQGILDDDIDSLVTSRAKLEVESGARLKGSHHYRDYVLHDLGVYWGFKHHNSAMACEKYMNQIEISSKAVSLVKQLACQILFYPDVDEEIEKILTDLAIFSISRKKIQTGKRADICSLIRNDKIKKACLSQQIKDLDDIFRFE